MNADRHHKGKRRGAPRLACTDLVAEHSPVDAALVTVDRDAWELEYSDKPPATHFVITHLDGTSEHATLVPGQTLVLPDGSTAEQTEHRPHHQCLAELDALWDQAAAAGELGEPLKGRDLSEAEYLDTIGRYNLWTMTDGSTWAVVGSQGVLVVKPENERIMSSDTNAPKHTDSETLKCHIEEGERLTNAAHVGSLAALSAAEDQSRESGDLPSDYLMEALALAMNRERVMFIRENPRRVVAYTPPRYDAVFVEGTKWLDDSSEGDQS